MPNCIQLFAKGETEASSFGSIDVAICGYLGVEVNPQYYVADWFNTIAFALAVGETFETLRLRYSTPDAYYKPEYLAKMLSIVNFLDENYSPDAWAEIGKR